MRTYATFSELAKVVISVAILLAGHKLLAWEGTAGVHVYEPLGPEGAVDADFPRRLDAPRRLLRNHRVSILVLISIWFTLNNKYMLIRWNWHANHYKDHSVAYAVVLVLLIGRLTEQSTVVMICWCKKFDFVFYLRICVCWEDLKLYSKMVSHQS